MGKQRRPRSGVLNGLYINSLYVVIYIYTYIIYVILFLYLNNIYKFTIIYIYTYTGL